MTLLVGLFMIIWLLVPAEARQCVPECPIAGHSTCSDQRDNDCDHAKDEAAPSLAFSSCTGGFCAEFEDNSARSGTLVSVADAAFSGGDYVHIPLGNKFGSGQAPLCVDATSAPGTYYLHLRSAVPSAARVWVWISLDAPLGNTLNNAAATLLADGQARPAPGWDYANTTDSVANFLTRTKGTAQKTYSLTGVHCFYVAPETEIRLDAAYLTTDINQQPQTGGGGQTTAEFVALELGANTITENGTCDEAAWSGANVVPFTGFDTSNNTCVWKVLWDNTTTDRIYHCLSCSDTDLRSATVTNDSGNIFLDGGAEILYSTNEQTAFDANTIKIVVNKAATQSHLDRNYPGGSSDNAYTASVLKGASRTGTLDATANDTGYTVEFSHAVGADMSPGALIRMSFRINDADASASYMDAKGAGGNIDDRASSGLLVELSNTAVSGADVTPPTVGAVSMSGVGSTGATATFTSNEAGSCAVRYDTDNDNAVSGGDLVTLNQGVVSGGQCVVVISGLTANTAYEIVGVVTDGQGNVGVSSSVTDFTTSGAGNEFFVDDAGSGTTCSSFTPCAISRLTASGEPRPSPGETWTVMNGTYPPVHIVCGSNAVNGTSGSPITVRAQNERQAFIQHTGNSGWPLRLDNCSHWTIEGLRVEWGDISGITQESHVVSVANSSNITLRRLLAQKPNRFTSGHVIYLEGTTNSLIEENEVYSFHRHGILLRNTTTASAGNIIRRNYVNSRSYADIPGGEDTSGIDSGRGDGGIVLYPSSGNIIENNIVENAAFCYDVISVGQASTGNLLAGNICLGPNITSYGLSFEYGASFTGVHGTNNTVRDYVVVDHRGVSGLQAYGINNQCINCSFLGTGFSGSLGRGLDLSRPSIATASPSSSFTCTNCLAIGNTEAGFLVTESASWLINFPAAFGNGTNYSPAASHANITNEVSLSSNPLGSCKVWIPTSTPIKGTGQGGADIGANVTHRYSSGVLSATEKLWITSAPAGYGGTSFPFYFPGGAVISGQNSDQTISLAGAANRLNIVSSCLPAGF